MRPNILFIHCHDLGRFLGCYGVPTVHTPSLDRLAAESAVFDLAFSAAPHCSPARAALFTGTYPQRNGVLGLTHSPFDWDLNDPSIHLARRLRTAGYRTELIGVHHESRTLPDVEVARRLGFDRVRTDHHHTTVADRAIESVQASARSDEPWYLQVGFHEPHRSPSDRDRPGVMGFLGPDIRPDSSLGVSVPAFLRDDPGAHEEIAELQGAVRRLDDGVGRILTALDSSGLRDDTIVVFTTDHGLALPRAKCTLYDPGLEVALMIRAPGRPAWQGTRVRTQVSHVDVVPTLFDLIDHPVDGVSGSSLTGLVEGRNDTARAVLGQLTHHIYYDPRRSVRTPEFKLIANFSNAPQAMDPTQSWIHRSTPAALAGPAVGSTAPLELYDLTADPAETTNLADEPDHQETVRSLARLLLDWMHREGDPLLAPSTVSPRHQHTLELLNSAVAQGKESHVKRRLFVAATAVVATALSLTGCTSGENSPGDANGKVVLWMYPVIKDPAASKKFWQDATQSFEKAHPGTHLEIQLQTFDKRDAQISAALAAGSGPDIVLITPDQAATYLKVGGLLPVDDAVSASRGRFYPGSLRAATFGGKTYGVPIFQNIFTTAYNTKVFTDAGVALPRTWSDIKAAAPVLARRGVAVMDYAGNPEQTLNMSFYPLVWQAGGRIFSQDGKDVAFDSPQGVAALQFLVDLKKAGGLPADAATEGVAIEGSPMAAGKVGLRQLTSLPELGQLRAALGKQTVVLGRPIAGKAPVTYGGPGLLALTSINKSKNRAAAYQVLEYLSSPTFQKSLIGAAGNFPTRRDVQLDKSTPDLTAMRAALANANPGEPSPASRQVMTILAPHVQAALRGDVTPEEALKQAATEARTALQQS
ncbi:arylsulfatase A-like enzyme/ABC-type glycerol-3-phosphate transport system substrate-binding protein [Kribbella aluminosa]|uniref:Arylsulfatase A-like enzyme/ABC-type glycerol-3-phosphate transport system substrate-binding protein n=1 Tax=Kribbella aluminosa TaxID=416017 RepID=A0ABS4UWZ8_9ACTN|nr:extracellular solute-binding protein [Kribbella aluminosa]MBP2356160.1 arylsulfatase A-like enzyme/ABC-type glycerol-3-phosphate transport system substrate-binding protein [Kribbella aluminosa]